MPKRARGLKYFSTSGILFSTSTAKLCERSASVKIGLASNHSKTSSGLSPPTEEL